MDKNEVLKILETAKDKNGEVPMRLVRQAFEKLPEPCEDTISRQEAIDVLSLGKEILSRVLDDTDVVGTDREKYSWGLELIESNIKDIEELPSVQPERKNGKWIKVNGKTAINCSACYHCSWSLSFENTVKRFKFCPNCGAKMEEV